MQKFTVPKITAKGEKRAWVSLKSLDTLWFNTGTLCNLECKNCYIESSPKNDDLVYISLAEVKKFLDEIKKENLKTKEIGLTGGEPFMNPEIIPIITLILSYGFELLVLSNGMRPMQRYKKQLISLKIAFLDNLKIRISVDHYKKEEHQEIRGENSWDPMIIGLKFLSDNNFNFSIAGREAFMVGKKSKEGYEKTLLKNNIKMDLAKLILFPEMNNNIDTPEITVGCWDILKKSPDEIMCSNARMIVKRKGEIAPKVLACTLLAYDKRFELGETLKKAQKSVSLNHHYCSQFCVLGGASCS